MNPKQLYNKVCCVMQWNIGLANGDIKEIIREKRSELSFKWLPIKDAVKSIADPFIFKSKEGELNMIYEDFSMVDPKKYGKLELVNLTNDFEPISVKLILDAKSHLSYPFVFIEDNKTYIFPESRQQNKLSCFEFDFENKCLINERIIIDNLPLLDSTIFNYQNKYWLFATLGDNQFDHSKLYIYYSDSLFGPYKAHKNNPVKFGLDGTRPAGKIIEVDGEFYRPAQNCQKYYGESLSLYKILKLNENEFSEEFYMKISPEKNCEFDSGLHTLNILDNILVVDGIRMVFIPVRKMINFFRNKIGI